MAGSPDKSSPSFMKPSPMANNASMDDAHSSSNRSVKLKNMTSGMLMSTQKPAAEVSRETVVQDHGEVSSPEGTPGPHGSINL